jgi:pyruvyltransferase
MGIRRIIYKLINCLFKIYTKTVNTAVFFFIPSSKKIVLNSWVKLSGRHVLPNNLGDDINEVLIKSLTGKKIFFNNSLFCARHLTNYLCIGSIIETQCNASSIIWGAGARNSNTTFPAPKQVLAVRGPLTRNLLLQKGISCPEIYGDPALLLPYIYIPNVQKRYAVGVIYHYRDENHEYVNWLRKVNFPSVAVFDMRHYSDYRKIIDKITSCDLILSASLHGLIFADAYKIPNVWIKIEDKTYDGDFKYLDYLMSVGRKENHPISVKIGDNPLDLMKFREEYFSPTINLDQLISTFPIPLKLSING